MTFSQYEVPAPGLYAAVVVFISHPIFMFPPAKSSFSVGVIVQTHTLQVLLTLILLFPSPSAMMMLFDKVAGSHETFAQMIVLLIHVVIPRQELYQIATLFPVHVASIRFKRAPYPIPTLLLPLAFDKSALYPIQILFDPVVLPRAACSQIQTLFSPQVFD